MSRRRVLAILCTLSSLPQLAAAQLQEDFQLVASDGSPSDWFGAAVAIDGDRALVGAPREDHAGMDSAGTAYVFERDATGVWNQVFKIKPQDGEEHDSFGQAVSLFGDWALVGAPFDDDQGDSKGSAYLYARNSNGNWIQHAKLFGSFGPPNHNFGSAVSLWGAGERMVVGGSGFTAHVFERTGSDTWSEVARLLPLTPVAGFGSSVSIWGKRALVGSPYEGGPGEEAGAVYVFERQPGGDWIETTRLQPPVVDAGDRFGAAVSIHGRRALVGAPRDADFVCCAGAAYVFERNSGGAWVGGVKLYASDLAYDDLFGTTVALSGDRGLAGTPYADGQSGAAYTFERDPSDAWSETAILEASDAQSFTEFARSLAISGNRALVGRPEWPSSLPGAAYGYDLGVGETYCHSTANSTGTAAVLASTGSASFAANELALVASPVPDATGVLFLGPTQVNVPFGNGARCVGGSIVRMPFADVDSHVLSQRMDLGAPPLSGIVVPGSTWNFQAWFRDPPAGGAYFNTSSAIAILFEP